MIKKYSLIALQKAINHALSLDDNAMNRLKKMNGKALEIVISPLNVHFFILFQDNTLQLLPHYNKPAQTIIHSSPLGLIRLSLLPSSKVRSLFNDSIKMEGDISLGQDVKRLFDELDIDWEGHLAHFTGDVVAYQIGSFMRQGLAFKRRVSTSLQKNITSYVQEEHHLLPSQEEVNDFLNDVDVLSLRTERLAAHINQLLAHHDRN